MKYWGSRILARFSADVSGVAVSSGHYFKDIDLSIDPPVVDLGTANNGGEQAVDPTGAKARISVSGGMDDTSGNNLSDMYVPGAIVTLTAITGVPQRLLDAYAPWQIGPGGIRHAGGQASEDRIEFIGTKGAVSSSFDPDDILPAEPGGG